MICTEAEPFIGRHHTTSVIWKQKGKVWLKIEKRERENLVRTTENASPQRNPAFNKSPFNQFHKQAGLQNTTTLGSRPNLPNTPSTETDKWVSFQLQSHLLEIYFCVSEPTSSLKNNHLSIVWHSTPCNTYYPAGTELNQENKFETEILCAPEFTVTSVLKEVTCQSI